MLFDSEREGNQEEQKSFELVQMPFNQLLIVYLWISLELNGMNKYKYGFCIWRERFFFMLLDFMCLILLLGLLTATELFFLLLIVFSLVLLRFIVFIVAKNYRVQHNHEPWLFVIRFYLRAILNAKNFRKFSEIEAR